MWCQAACDMIYCAAYMYSSVGYKMSRGQFSVNLALREVSTTEVRNVALSHQIFWRKCRIPCSRHRGEGGAGGALAPPPPPPLFWLIKLLFQFFSKVLHKKVHCVFLCQTCGPQRKYCFFLIAPFGSNIVFWRFSWCLSRQFAEFLVRSR